MVLPNPEVICIMTQNRPQTGDYALYYGKYIALVPGGEFLDILESQLRDTKTLLSPLTDSQGHLRYAPGKWSIKETLGHVNDAERIFSYRLLRIARGDKAPLPGFEQDDYVKAGNLPRVNSQICLRNSPQFARRRLHSCALWTPRPGFVAA